MSIGTAPQRILIVTDAWHPQVNGVVRTYEHLGTELEKLGHAVRIIGPRDFPRRLKMPGYAEIELALFPRRRLAAMIEAFAPTALHIGTEGPLGHAARRYALQHDKRFSTAYHTEFPAYIARRMPFMKGWSYALANAALRRFHRPAAIVITTTPGMTTALRARGYTAPLAALPRGVPLDQFAPGPATLFADMKQPVALYVGRVATEKNIEAFLAMAWPGGKVVVGDGPSRAALAARYPDVLFTGQKTGAELAAHYRAADLFVFPSRTDTFGIVLLEALASGLPVAAYNVPGPRDIITEPFLGALDDDLALAAQRTLLQQPHHEKRRAHVEVHYAWPAIARRFAGIVGNLD